MTLTFGSLFSGIGGIDLGLEMCGLQGVWQVEKNSYCLKVLQRHWPKVFRHDDIRTFWPDETFQVDVIAGGFPCKQTSCGASIINNRKGLDGRDSGLWWDMLRVVESLKPKCVLVENPASEYLQEVQAGLEGVGYNVSRPVVSAQSVGAPHLRKRMFVIAHTTKSRLPLPRQRGVRRHTTTNAWIEGLARLRRVADGVSNRMDPNNRTERIRALGNAAVPLQVKKVVEDHVIPFLRSE